MANERKEEIAAEIERARGRLKELGRDIPEQADAANEGGIRSDFDLPYSSFPRFFGARWNQNETIA